MPIALASVQTGSFNFQISFYPQVWERNVASHLFQRQN